MIYHVKQGTLLLVQIDHLSGELLGGLAERLLERGAKNVQLIPTISKKSRPGYLLMIDAPDKQVPSLEEFLVTELGATGWHRIPTEHAHISTKLVFCSIVFRTETTLLEMEVCGKRIKRTPLSVRPEHDVCREVQKRLFAERGVQISLQDVERLVGQALNSGESSVEVDLRNRVISQDGISPSLEPVTKS